MAKATSKKLAPITSAVFKSAGSDESLGKARLMVSLASWQLKVVPRTISAMATAASSPANRAVPASSGRCTASVRLVSNRDACPDSDQASESSTPWASRESSAERASSSRKRGSHFGKSTWMAGADPVPAKLSTLPRCDIIRYSPKASDTFAGSKLGQEICSMSSSKSASRTMVATWRERKAASLLLVRFSSCLPFKSPKLS